MLTILHTGDIHLGATLEKLKKKKDEQRIQIQRTFENIVNLAMERKVDILLIAGDLFDSSRPDKSLTDFVASNFAKLNDRHIYTCIGLGTHDFLTEQSPYANLDVSALPYVKLFNNPEETSFAMQDLSTVVFCNCSVSNKSSHSPLEGIERNEDYRYNIAMAHGSVQIPGKSSANDSPIYPEQIAKCGMDYVALGHWHNQQDVSNGGVCAWYCGAPEMIDLDQSNSGSILLVHLQEDKSVQVESVRVGKRVFDEMTVTIDGLQNAEALVEKIRVNPNPDLIRKVVIQGMAPLAFGQINVEEIQHRLASDFFYLMIKDTSHIQMDSVSIEEGNIMKMKFVENIQSLSVPEEVKEEALKLGLMLMDGSAKVY